VSFAAITLCVASQRLFIVVVLVSLSTQSGNFWIRPRTVQRRKLLCLYHIRFPTDSKFERAFLLLKEWVLTSEGMYLREYKIIQILQSIEKAS
jgi:hypothetical protein